MSEQTRQPNDTAPLIDSAGHIDYAALHARVNAALLKTEPPRPVLRLRVERVGNEVKMICPCGKTRLLSTQHINVFCQTMDRFLDEHSWCDPEEQE